MALQAFWRCVVIVLMIGQARAEAIAPQTIVVFGDEQANGLATAMRDVAHNAYPKVEILDRTKPGSSLVQGDHSDWPSTVRAFVSPPDVKLAVLMLGTNDRVPMTNAPAVQMPFRSFGWERAYRARIAAIIHGLSERKLFTVWVGQPIGPDRYYDQDMEYLNAIQRRTVLQNEAAYLDIWTTVSDADGQFTAFGHGLDGKTARLRQADGVHFTPSGYELLAKQVLDTIAAMPQPAR
jgi:uncharacterized protein